MGLLIVHCAQDRPPYLVHEHHGSQALLVLQKLGYFLVEYLLNRCYVCLSLPALSQSRFIFVDLDDHHIHLRLSLSYIGVGSFNSNDVSVKKSS